MIIFTFMKDFIGKLDFYIRNYNLEEELYKNGSIIKRRGHFTKQEFLLICLWKSRRPKRHYLKNTESQVKRITKAALSCKDEKEKIKILIQLKGVAIPTATALLSVADPTRYPIIDVRCVKSLNDLQLIKWKAINFSNWLEYLEIIRKMAKSKKKTARNIEKGLFAYNRIKLDQVYKNLY